MSKNEVIRQIDPYEIGFNAERKRYEELSQEAGNLGAEIERLNKAYSELEGQKTIAATDRDAHKSRAQTLEKEVRRLEKDNAKLKEDYAALDRGYKKAQQIIEEERRKYNAKPAQGNDELVKKIQRLEAENRELSRQNEVAHQWMSKELERRLKNGG